MAATDLSGGPVPPTAGPSRTARVVAVLHRVADRPWSLPAVSVFPLTDYVLPFMPGRPLAARSAVRRPARAGCRGRCPGDRRAARDLGAHTARAPAVATAHRSGHLWHGRPAAAGHRARGRSRTGRPRRRLCISRPGTASATTAPCRGPRAAGGRGPARPLRRQDGLPIERAARHTARALLVVADECQVRVALLGDRRQLAAVGRGGVLSLAARHVDPTVHLTVLGGTSSPTPPVGCPCRTAATPT